MTPETNYNDGLWHGWNGGDCPVHPATICEGIEQDLTHWKTYAANNVGWRSFRGAFRVINEHKEPREFWLFENGHGDTCVSDVWRDGAIHVREVSQ